MYIYNTHKYIIYISKKNKPGTCWTLMSEVVIFQLIFTVELRLYAFQINVLDGCGHF